MGNDRSLIKSILGFSISSWVNMLLGVFYTVLSTRLIDPDVYGLVSMFMQGSDTVMYVLCLGLDASLIRFFNERPNNESKQCFQTKLIFIITLNTLIFFCVSTIFLFDELNSFMFGRMSWFLTIMLFISAYAHLLLRFFNISYRMSFDIKRYTLQNILIQSSTKILTLLAAFLNPTYEMIITFQIVGIVVITLTYAYLQRNELLENVFVPYKGNMLVGYNPIFVFALFSAPVYISNTLNILLSQSVIRGTLGETILGIYSSVAIFGNLFRVISTGFSTFWSAYVYKNYKTAQGRIQEMSDYIVIVGFISMCMFVLFKDVLYFFIGEKFYDGIYFFSLILTVNVIDLLSQASCYGIGIVKKNYITALTNCIYLGANALGVYIGATWGGIIGAAFGIMIVKLLLFGVNTTISQRFYKSVANISRFYIGILLTMLVATIPSFVTNVVYTCVIITASILVSVFVFSGQYRRLLSMAVRKYSK